METSKSTKRTRVVCTSREKNAVANYYVEQQKTFENLKKLQICSKATHFRSIDQLKSKYDNLKTKARKVVADNRKYLKKTGGGGSNDDKFDPIIEAVLKIINVKTVTGFINEFDSDYPQRNIEILEVVRQDEVLENVAEQPATFSDVELLINEHLIPIQTSVVPPPTAERARVLSSNEEMETPADVNTNLLKNQNWSSYTPHKMRQPITKKLRQGMVNPVILAKAEYYKTKTLEAEADMRNKQQEEKRREEEHQKKMKLLDLEIILKEKEVHKN